MIFFLLWNGLPCVWFWKPSDYGEKGFTNCISYWLFQEVIWKAIKQCIKDVIAVIVFVLEKICGLNHVNKQIHRHQVVKSSEKSSTPLSWRICGAQSKLQTRRLTFIKTEWGWEVIKSRAFITMVTVITHCLSRLHWWYANWDF